MGLPDGQMGNSEVGHLNIGAGRVVYQDFTRIDHAIETGEFAANPVLNRAVDAARDGHGALHVLGLLSPGGVHSHERQIAAMVELAAARGVAKILVHAFLDGRDTPPRSAAASLAFMDAVCASCPGARIASVVGRYYAMDRDQHWERVAEAYELLVDGSAPYVADLGIACARGRLRARRKRRIRQGHRHRRCPGKPATMRDGDVVVFMNFRADRARQMTRALTSPAFTGFRRARVPRLADVRMPHVVRRRVRATSPWPSRRRRSATASASIWRSSASRSSASRRPRNMRTSPTSSTAAWKRRTRARTACWSRPRESPPTTCSPR